MISKFTYTRCQTAFDHVSSFFFTSISWFKAYRVKLKDSERVSFATDERTATEEKQITIGRLHEVRDVFVFVVTPACRMWMWKVNAQRDCDGHDGVLNSERIQIGNLPESIRVGSPVSQSFASALQTSSFQGRTKKVVIAYDSQQWVAQVPINKSQLNTRKPETITDL